MNQKQLKSHSKYLSLILRHQPQIANLTLDHEGWVDVKELLKALQRKDRKITWAELDEIVETNNKKIRASQGHSIDVDLKLVEREPPASLYHGTAKRNLKGIMGRSLHKANRQHVHLSDNPLTAISVGSRHGSPVVLEVNAKKMHEDGNKFYLSANGVWLTENILPKYLQVLSKDV